ncbi:cellulose biosynthesis cyclic di-GMP-binding regulatory protein BcsB [Clostridium hydrogenum]|uniref:cellulose biosynthesis cyclic di-GMP-binding regulatory protein BcsB n=1 Tax=Clostridium hydrogenum TaxID=2855764 RepID=UPI001F1E3ADB|nr:cellulose biosynthesis cyclic di-GMP-binding regulatory protein BcsB [Clostridium hydrogenum]
MNRRRFSICSLIILIMLTINIVFGAIPIHAATNDIKTKSFSFGSDVNFKGVFSSHSLYFTIDKYSVPKSVQANIIFTISQLVTEAKNATITFSVNGTSFYSSKVFYKDNTEEQNIQVSIPMNLIKSGINEFKVETYCRISDGYCTDDVNNANWITLKKDSSILMQSVDKESTNNISEFPYPFIKANEDNNNNVAIAIPDNYNEDELTAALMLQSYFGKLNGSEGFKGVVMKYSSIPKDKDIIYIGGFKSLPSNIKALYGSKVSAEDYNGAALIKRSNSPFNNDGKLMSILSDDGDMLIKAIKLLMNNDLVSQINTDTFKVDKSVKVDENPQEESINLTFKDLGLNEMQLTGPFRQSASLSYTLPSNRVLASGAKIKLFVRYSQNLDFDRSLLTIYINGTPIGSKKLEKDLANGDQLELPIPNDVKISNYIDIKVAFDLEQKNSTCEFRQEETPWALVTGDSYIYIPNNKLNFYKFETYPQPFISEREFNDVAIVVPENLSEDEIEGISKMFSYMGNDMSYNSGNLKVVDEKDFSSKYNNMNLILYGTPQNNKVIKALNSKLWFKYNDQYNSFIGNEKLYLTNPYASNISVFQFDVSPYNESRAALILTSPNEDLLLKSLQYLTSSDGISKISGDCALIDSYGNARSFRFKKDNTNSMVDKLQSIKTNGKVFIGFIAMLLIFSILAVVLYKYKYKKFK